MAYAFAGFFACTDGAVLNHALRTWPQCHGRLITAPFEGIGIAAPDRLHVDSTEIARRAEAVAQALDEELPAWSQQNPLITFVYLQAECFGGLCDYNGYVCRDGYILLRASGNSHSDVLKRLLCYLGLELNDRSYFAPLKRTYFD